MTDRTTAEQLFILHFLFHLHSSITYIYICIFFFVFEYVFAFRFVGSILFVLLTLHAPNESRLVAGNDQGFGSLPLAEGKHVKNWTVVPLDGFGVLKQNL